MDRKNNISKGKNADEKIIKWMQKLEGSKLIHEIKDYQMEIRQGKELTRQQQLDNYINMVQGTDYIYKFIQSDKGIIVETVAFIDTKGFNYNQKYYGNIDNNGIVEYMIFQIEKSYGGKIYRGWANEPSHKTSHIVILINDLIYIIKYQKLLEYLNQMDIKQYRIITFNKNYGNYEKCIQVPTNELIQNGVIVHISTTE